MLFGQQALMQMIQCELEHLICVSVWIVVDEDIWGHALPMVPAPGWRETLPNGHLQHTVFNEGVRRVDRAFAVRPIANEYSPLSF